MSSESYENVVLAVDMGTSGPKVCLVDGRGRLIAHEFEPTELILLPGGGQEQRPDEWWGAITDAAKRLIGRNVVPVDAIKTIAVTTQWSGTVAVDESGQPLMNAVGWMDTRGAKHIEKITGGFPRVERYAVAKALQWVRFTGGAPGHSGKDSLAHILWMKYDAPSIYQKAYKFLEPKDWVNQQLTGKFAASYDSIALYWATDNRDINNIDYHPKLLELSGLDRAKLPDLKKSTDVLGTITFDVARDWGLNPDVEVVMGTPDVHSAAVGSGGVRDFEPHVYLGTSSWLTCHVPFKKTDLLNNMASLPSAIPGRYLVMNEQEAAGSCLTWLRDKVFFPDDALRQAPPPEDVYAAFDRLAETSAPGAGKLLFAPWLIGERTPIEDHHVRGGWFNMSLQSTRADMVRSVLEGVALNSRWLLGAVEKFCKRRFESIRIIGGGAFSDTWCQIYADVLDRPIKQMGDPLAAGARGAACLALVGSGRMSFEQFGQSVEVAQTFHPRREHRHIYDELFTEFKQLYKSNKAAYQRLNGH